MPASHRLALACAALVALATPALAQGADSSSSLIGATMVDLQAGAWLSPGPGHSLQAQGVFRRFVSEHWELGLAPAVSGYTAPHATAVGVGVAGVANYMIGGGRTRAYVGGYASGSGGSQGGGSAVIGAQAGGLYFLAPATTVRAELRARQWSTYSGHTVLGATMALEPYIGRLASGASALPQAGVTDASLSAAIDFNNSRQRHLDIMIAPFLASWAQVGGEYEGFAVPANGGWPTTHRFNGFARLYAPLSPRAMPFIHGFAEATEYPSGVSAPTSVGLMGGVRHYLNRGAAFDAGLQWRHYQATDVAVVLNAPGGSTSQLSRPDELTLQARIVVELHAH